MDETIPTGTVETNPIEDSLVDAASSLVDKNKGWEHNMPVHVLMSELIPALYDPASVFVCTKNTESWNEADPDSAEGFVFNDPDFKSFEREEEQMAISYTGYQKYILPGQKNLTVFHLNLNEAYLPFNTWKAGVIMDYRESEVERSFDFRKQNPESAFEKPFTKEAFKESIVLNYDGYVYSFYKILSYDDREKYLIKIEQYTSEAPNSVKKEILSTTEMKSMDSARFGSLLEILEERKKKSRKNQ